MTFDPFQAATSYDYPFLPIFSMLKMSKMLDETPTTMTIRMLCTFLLALGLASAKPTGSGPDSGPDIVGYLILSCDA